MTEVRRLDRREFLKLTGIAGTGLLLGLNLSGCGSEPDAPRSTQTPTSVPTEGLAPTRTAAPEPTATSVPPREPYELHAFISITPNDVVTIVCHRSEMGQGVRTALPMIMAEEMCADWSTVRVVQAQADEKVYGSHHTASSTSIVSNYARLRRFGATARAMLIAAAADVWEVDRSTCRAKNGRVIHDETGRQLTFGQLAEAAAQQRKPPRNQIILKDPADFEILGTDIKRVDGKDVVQGSATYGMDVRVPDMLVAAIARCPIIGGHLASWDPGAASEVDGVVKVVEVDQGIAVVAQNTWAAISGRGALNIQWEPGEDPAVDTDGVRATLEAHLQSELDRAYQDYHLDSDRGTSRIDAIYENQYLAHATMEPMNCTADVRKEAAELWAPTQTAGTTWRELLLELERPVTLNVTLMGCGLGRRTSRDFVFEAMEVSQAVGAPVQVVWTREDDIRHDRFRPASLHGLRADLNSEGLPVGWVHVVAGQTFETWDPLDQGLGTQSYDLGTQLHRTTGIHLPIPVGILRAVYNNNNAFAIECFLDEIAAAGSWDPLDLRERLITSERKLSVLQRVAEIAHWGTTLPDGWGRGLACHTTWGMTDVAQVAEVSVRGDGALHVHRIYCAVDCGRAIHPGIIGAQMESGIAVGLSAILGGEITFSDGRVDQRGLRDYAVLRMNQMPEIDVAIIESDREPQGVGEMATPPIAPAVANAVFDATGKRIRRLPIGPDLLSASH